MEFRSIIESIIKSSTERTNQFWYINMPYNQKIHNAKVERILKVIELENRQTEDLENMVDENISRTISPEENCPQPQN